MHLESDMSQTDVRNKLARSYLIANELGAAEKSSSLANLEVDEENEKAALKRDVLVDFIPLWEYRMHPLSSRSNGEFLVRTYELLCRLERANSNICTAIGN